MLLNASRNLIFTAPYAYTSTYAWISPNQCTSNITTNILYTFIYNHIKQPKRYPTSLPLFLSKTQNCLLSIHFTVTHELLPTYTTCLTISNHLASNSISMQNIARLFTICYNKLTVNFFPHSGISQWPANILVYISPAFLNVTNSDLLNAFRILPFPDIFNKQIPL